MHMSCGGLFLIVIYSLKRVTTYGRISEQGWGQTETVHDCDMYWLPCVNSHQSCSFYYISYSILLFKQIFRRSSDFGVPDNALFFLDLTFSRLGCFLQSCYSFIHHWDFLSYCLHEYVGFFNFLDQLVSIKLIDLRRRPCITMWVKH